MPHVAFGMGRLLLERLPRLTICQDQQCCWPSDPRTFFSMSVWMTLCAALTAGTEFLHCAHG